MIDIENKEVLIQYLFDKKVINDKDGYSINYCIGGVSCIAAFIMAGDAPILIKQAREKLNVAVEWLADQERIAIESRANEIYHELVPEYAPKVIFYDPENYVLVREAAPYSWKMWKSNLLEGTLDFGVARKTMEALATVHNKTANNTKVAKDFSNYTVFEQLRISPYIDYVIQQYPELTTKITAIKEKILSRHIALVHADYSPKNILTEDGEICILDYEIAHYGDPIFDTAFFLNHIALKSIKNKQWAAAYLNMFEYMADVYFNMIQYDKRVNVEHYCIKILGLMMLARIDGKSPVEYLTEESDKQIARKISAKMIKGGVMDIASASKLILETEKAN